jgi:hypothetical protein
MALPPPAGAPGLVQASGVNVHHRHIYSCRGAFSTIVYMSTKDIRDSTDSIEKGGAVGLQHGSDLGSTSPTGQAETLSKWSSRVNALDVGESSAMLLDAQPLASPMSLEGDHMAIRSGLQAMLDDTAVDGSLLSPGREADELCQGSMPASGPGPTSPSETSYQPLTAEAVADSRSFGPGLSPSAAFPVLLGQGDGSSSSHQEPNLSLSSPAQPLTAGPSIQANNASPIPLVPNSSKNLIQRFNNGRQAPSGSEAPLAAAESQAVGCSEELSSCRAAEPSGPLRAQQPLPEESRSPRGLRLGGTRCTSASQRNDNAAINPAGHRPHFDVDDPAQVSDSE